MDQSNADGGRAPFWPAWLRDAVPEGPRQFLGRARKRLRRLKKAPLIEAVRDGTSRSLAEFRRPRLQTVTFIGVTGSCAKTTTSVFAKAILLPGDRWQKGSSHNVSEAVWRVDPSDRYLVQELSADRPGRLARDVSLLKPQIGIVTVIRDDHYKLYRGREETARAKGRLVEALPKDGVAILNADDPLVLAMAARTAARVLTYGLSPSADIKATHVSSVWPEPLELTVAHGEERTTIRTRFFGEHWADAVLAATACGIACGFDLKSCAAAIAKVDPLFGRYSAHTTPLGASFVLDTFKAPFWTIAGGLDFVKKANATRKTVVIGTISDYPGSASKRYRRVARDALEVADRVVFVGPHASHVDKLRQGETANRLMTFVTSFQASAFLAETALPGELIYVKSSLRTDHLERLMLSQLESIVCWREGCGASVACRKCVNYSEPTPPPLGIRKMTSSPLPSQPWL